MTARAYAFNSADFAFETFANEIVVLNVVEGTYFAFGGSSIDIWDALANRRPVQAIVDATAARHGVPARLVEQELSNFIAKLAAEKILLAAQPADDPISLPASPPTRGFQPFSFEKHDDMEDLLTLDPIHDVDPERGWPRY
ncbi:MAG: PqqD family protein [Xanthobacteraceae bacterium]|nr:PqqD family protein [Xanthobacteraceae bacterium]